MKTIFLFHAKETCATVFVQKKILSGYPVKTEGTLVEQLLQYGGNFQYVPVLPMLYPSHAEVFNTPTHNISHRFQAIKHSSPQYPQD